MTQPTSTDSAIHLFGNGGASFVGPDAVELFRIKSVRSALKLLKVGLTPTRGFTQKKGLELAAQITGKAYKGKTKLDDAIADLSVKIDEKAKTIPITQD